MPDIVSPSLNIQANGFRHVAEDELHAYVDGVLPPEDRERVESYLSSYPRERQRVEAYRRQNVRLHRLFDWYAQIPDTDAYGYRALAARYARMERRLTRINKAFRAAVAVFALAIAGGTGWFAASLSEGSPTESRGFIEQAVEAHVLSGLQDGSAGLAGGKVKWGADRPRWIGSDFRPVAQWAPDFRAEGYALVQGAILPTGWGPAVHFLYSGKDGARVSLFIAGGAAGLGEISETAVERNGLAVIQLRRGKNVFSLVGDVTAATLAALARIAGEQIVEPPAVAAPDNAPGLPEEKAGLAVGGTKGGVTKITLNP